MISAGGGTQHRGLEAQRARPARAGETTTRRCGQPVRTARDAARQAATGGEYVNEQASTTARATQCQDTLPHCYKHRHCQILAGSFPLWDCCRFAGRGSGASPCYSTASLSPEAGGSTGGIFCCLYRGTSRLAETWQMMMMAMNIR
jgi:hypothetical protein